jgi:protein O-GlcNAc transferase
VSKRALAERAPALRDAALRQQRAGKLELAVELYEQALRVGGDSAGVLCNLGEACRKLGRFERAVGVLSRAAALEPLFAPAHYNLGLALDQQGSLASALESYARALELEPDLPHLLAYFLEGARELRRYPEAEAAYTRFAVFVNDSSRLRRAIGNVLLDLFRVDEALQHLQAALTLDPAVVDGYVELAAAYIERGQAEAAITELRRALRLDPSALRAHASLVYLLPFAADTTPDEVLAEALRFNERHAAAITPLSGHRASSQRLRVGYVSPDFREHPLALFLSELFLHHDREKVELFCYSSVAHPDATTAKILALADAARDISRLSDAAAAQQIFDDGIDVLVDLAMHTGQSRPLLFARKPAKVQACWLAYPGTTGLSAIDYRLTDRYLDPPGAPEPYSEQSLHIDSFWCYAPPDTEPEPNQLPALTRGFPTFGSLHSFKKVSPQALELWALLLRAMPAARFVVVAPPGESSARVLRAFEVAGVAPSRVELLRHAPRSSYLAEFHAIDCCVDTWPYGGATSSLDAFWMGVPVVTLLGNTVAGRAGACIAQHLGLPELVAESPDDFVARASALAQDLPRLAELRAGLRARLCGSALMNGPKNARSVEAAFLAISRRP